MALFNASATNGIRMWKDLLLNNYVIGGARYIGTIDIIAAGRDIVANSNISGANLHLTNFHFYMRDINPKYLHKDESL